MNKLEHLIKEYCPNGVKKIELKDITERISDGMHNLPQSTDDVEGFPIISAINVHDNIVDFNTQKYVSADIFAIENKRTCAEEGDVLLTIVGAVGRTALMPKCKGVLFQRSVCVIKPKKTEVYSKYLKYVIDSKSIQEIIEKQAHGAAQKGIYIKQVEKLLIPLPPLEVQNEIVRILDSFTELTAELTAELAARKKQYEFYRDKLLTFDETVAGGWRVKITSLNEIAELGTGNSNTNEAVEDGIYPFFVRSQNPLKKNTYEFDETAIITAGDGVGVGKVFHFIEGKYALHQRAYRIHIIDENIIPKFIYYYLQAKFYDYICKIGFHSSVSSIRRPMLADFKVSIPSIEIQKRIVKVLDNFDAICEDLNIGLPAEIEARKKQYEYYRDLLLTFAETGSRQTEYN